MYINYKYIKEVFKTLRSQYILMSLFHLDCKNVFILGGIQ